MPLAWQMRLPYQDRPVFTLLLAQGGEFAFVVFQAAAGSQVFTPQTASLLIGAVAVSMLLSPLLLVAVDRLLLPRYANCNTPALEEISEHQNAPVIVAGLRPLWPDRGSHLAGPGDCLHRAGP
jgi:glutathione-regulated potassium-efflux system ancillary protein KefC